MHIVFLDQNKWVDLARVAAGRSLDLGHREVYERLRSDANAGKFIAPLSITQIIETAKRNDPDQRRHLASAQAELSQGYVYRSRRARLELEIANAIRIAFGDPIDPVERGQVVVQGFYRAFEPMDTPDEVVRQAAFSAVMPPPTQYLEFMVTQDDQRRREAIASFTQGTLELLKNLEGRRALVAGHKPAFRYRAYAAKLFFDHQDSFIRGLSACGRRLQAFKALGDEAMVAFLRNIPTLHVEAEIVARLEVQDRPLQDNDIRDVQSFYTAIPYSSAIVAERHFVSLAKQARLDEQYGVALHTKLSELSAVVA